MGKTSTTISIEEDLLQKLREWALEEKRGLSNLIEFYMDKALDERGINDD